MDAELALKIAEEERIKRTALNMTGKDRIWPKWTKERITKLDLPALEPFWFHPAVSQRINVDANYQLDMPLCPRSFIFKFMHPAPTFTGNDETMNKILIDFYAKKSKPQNEVWSSIPIKTILRIKRTDLIQKAFYNWEFEITRGTEMKKSTVSFADLPLMNPSDWINIFQIMVLKCEEWLQPHIRVFKLLMQNYIFEMSKYDVVAAELMKRPPHEIKSIYVDYGINSDGLITKEPWGVVVKVSVGETPKHGHILMTDLYTITPNILRMLKQKIFLQTRNSAEDKKEVYDMIVWYEAVRSKIITFFNFMNEHEVK